MDLVIDGEGDPLVLRCVGARLDASIAVQFKEKFRALVGENTTRVILDMNEVDFMDSSGLGAIVAVYKLLTPAISLDLAAPSQTVDRVFRLTRMDTIFNIYTTVEAAKRGGDPEKQAS